MNHLVKITKDGEKMDINRGRAFLAGVVGGAALSLFLGMAQSLDLPIYSETLFIGFLGAHPDPGSMLCALFTLLTASGVLALIYALGFKMLHGAGVLKGIILGAVHAGTSAIVLSFAMVLNASFSGIAATPEAPGTRIASLLVFFFLHLLYGAVVGCLCAPRSDEIDPGMILLSSRERAPFRVLEPCDLSRCAPRPHRMTLKTESRKLVQVIQKLPE